MITCRFEHGKTSGLRHAVVHALAAKDGALLLVKRSPTIPEGGKWAIPGGFMDRNESGEQAVLRELQEETGWKGEVVSFFRLNTRPDRPRDDRQNVVLEYIINPLRLVGTPDAEQTDVRFFPFDSLPPLPELAYDYGESVSLFLDYLKRPFPLPIIR